MPSILWMQTPAQSKKLRSGKRRSAWRTSAWVFGLGVVALLAVFASLTDAQTVISLTGCQTITNAGSYRLENNVSSSGTCFSIRASNVTFDGNGKTITATGGDAVEVADYGSGPYHTIQISNFSSSNGVRNYGDNNSDITFANATFGEFGNYGGDSITVRGNTINGGVISDNTNGGCIDDATCAWWNQALNFHLENNTITGSASRFIDFHNYGDATHPCPASGRVVTGNTITNTIDTLTDNPLTVYLACSTNDVFDNNLVIATGQATGFLIRDGWTGGTFTNNTIHVNHAVNDQRGGLTMVSGNEGAAFKGFPSNNTFRGNTIIADNGKALWIQAIAQNNVFSNNILYSNSPTGSHLQPKNTYDHNTFYNQASNGSGVTFDVSGAANTVWTNNIVSSLGNSIDNTNDYTGFTAHHNLYHKRNGSVSFGAAASLAGWKTLSGEQANSIEGDPLFVNAATYDLSLQAGSPAIGAGSNGTNIGADPSAAAPPPPPSACTENWQCSAWSVCQNGQQSRTCTDANGCGTNNSRPALTQACTNDTQAPSVTITSPATQTSVQGQISIAVAASDDTGVTRVDYFLDTTQIGASTVSPFSLSWDSSSVAAGTHQLTARAQDAAGNQTTSQPISITTNGASAVSSSSSTRTSSGGTGSSPSSADKSVQFVPEVPLPGFLGGPISGESVAQYIQAVFILFIWVVGILATVMVVYGGIRWVTAAGNAGRINDARDIINNAIIGVILALVSVVLLNLINPQLTKFQGLTIATVDQKLFELNVQVAKQVGEWPACAATTLRGDPDQACANKVSPACQSGLNRWINDAAGDYKVDRFLVKAIIMQESKKTSDGYPLSTGTEVKGADGRAATTAYGIGQFVVGTMLPLLKQVNGSLPSACPESNNVDTATNTLIKSCRDWLDAHLETQVRMAALYLAKISQTSCVNRNLIYTAFGYYLGPGNATRYCQGEDIKIKDASAARLQQLQNQGIGYVLGTKANYDKICTLSKVSPTPGPVTAPRQN